MYLSRFKRWSLTDKLDSYIYWELRKSVFHTTLDIYKDYFKGCLTWCKGFMQAYCDQRQFALVHLSLKEVAAFVRHKVLWPRSFLIFVVWMNWRTFCLHWKPPTATKRPSCINTQEENQDKYNHNKTKSSLIT